MAQRYFSGVALHPGTVVELDATESHHLLHVMRANVGDRICVFDGGPAEFFGQIVGKDRRHVRVEVLECSRNDSEPTRRILVAAPIPKGDRFRFLIEKLTELGAVAYLPLVTQRSVNSMSPALLKKAEQWMIEACKQSLRNRRLQILAPQDISTVLARPGIGDRIVACTPRDAQECFPQAPPDSDSGHFSAESGDIPGSGGDRDLPDFDLLLLVGPEGGLTPEELAAASGHGFRPLVIGPHVLRIETASMAGLAVLLEESRLAADRPLRQDVRLESSERLGS